MKFLFYLALAISLFFSGFGYGQGQAETHIDHDHLIDELSRLKADMVKENKLGNRFKIQIASLSSLDEAKKIERKFKSAYRGIPADVQYESPNYKVWVGDFTSKLKAERIFVRVKKTYKSAFIFQPKR